MEKLVVNVKKLNKRSLIPSSMPDKNNIAGIVFQNYAFNGEEVTTVPNSALGRWFKDMDGYFYWGGGLNILGTLEELPAEALQTDGNMPEHGGITPEVKTKIKQVINVFETGSVQGDYSKLVKFKDHLDPVTKTKTVQVTYGRSQTTEFSNLKELIQNYINDNGAYAAQLQLYVNKIGKTPSLATDDTFCQILIEAGKKDPIMKTCQDVFFDTRYYNPANNWFINNGFTMPLSLLVIYDSQVHSGGILPFLRKRFLTNVPASGGNENEWINNYVEVRQNWLANHSDPLLRKTVYRTHCFHEQILNKNWDLSQKIIAHGVAIV